MFSGSSKYGGYRYVNIHCTVVDELSWNFNFFNFQLLSTFKIFNPQLTQQYS